MGLLTLLDLIFTYVERLRKFREDVRRTHKTMGSFLDHIRGFVHITFSIGLVSGATWSYWTFGTCCTSAILSTILLLLVLWERTLLKLLNYVSLVTRMQCKTSSQPQTAEQDKCQKQQQHLKTRRVIIYTI